MSIETASVMIGATTPLSPTRASAQNYAAVGVAISTCDYTYAPFGDSSPTGTLAEANPWRFSSEYADDELGCVYYNYRHYDVLFGRWLERDPLLEFEDVYVVRNMKDRRNNFALSLFVMNSPIMFFDRQGLETFGIRQFIRNIASYVRPWFDESCAKCGPDITDSLKLLKSQVFAEFELLKMEDPERAKSSCSIFSPKSFNELKYAISGWDINGLAFADVSIRDEKGVAKCPFGYGCSETVMVNGQCHWKWSVNYFLFGWMAHLCNCSKNDMSRLIRLWKATKPTDYGKISDAVNFAESAYDGFPDSGYVPPESEYSHCESCDK